MEKKLESGPPAPPSSVGDYDDNQSTYTIEQPPPAYRKPEFPSIKVARLMAVTILLVTLLAGLSAVAIVYMQHNLKCAQLATTNQESPTTAGSTVSDLPRADKVVQERPDVPPSTTTESNDDKGTLFPDLLPAEAQDQLRKLSFPIHIDMDDITGRMMDKNQRARLNCVIEKKRSEEIIPRSSKTLQTPFGNLTTDPKFTHITGETMSLTCRSGNERTSRPVAAGKPTPILIQIPLQPARVGQQLQQQQQLARPENSPMPGPMGPPILQNFPTQRQLQQPPVPLQQQRPNIMPQHQEQQHPPRPFQPQPQAAPTHQHQLTFNGPIPLHPQPPPMISEQPQQRLLNPFQQLRLPFLPIPQFPQIPLREVIPHLLEVHKQIQQQRREDEQQQRREQQQRHHEQTKVEQRLEQDEDNEHEEQHESQESVAAPHRGPGPQGRAMPMHDIPLQQRIVPHNNPFMQPPPHQAQVSLQHLHPQPIIGHPEGKHMERQQQQPPHPQLVPQQQQQPPPQHSDEEEHEHRHGDPELHLEVGAAFHNGPRPAAPDMMIERAGPLPFIVGSHNMQPRSSARPRNKRMAGSCSCVCK